MQIQKQKVEISNHAPLVSRSVLGRQRPALQQGPSEKHMFGAWNKQNEQNKYVSFEEIKKKKTKN